MDDEIGSLSEIRGKTVVEWKIKNFFSRSHDVDKYYKSPRFYFSGSSWNIGLYPNGQIRTNSEKWIGLFLFRVSNGSPITVDCVFNLKTIDNEKYIDEEIIEISFENSDEGFGCHKIISRLDLIEKKCQLAATDDLIVVCTLKNREPVAVFGSLFHRHQKISDMLREIYLKEKNWDIRLEVDSKILYAHKLILETRSPVFHDMLRDQTAKDRYRYVKDADFKTMYNLLFLMYSGDIHKLTRENSLSLYAAAVKFDIEDAKEMCAEFIKKNLSVECVLSVIKIIKLYPNEAILDEAYKFFKENADKILETDNWKRFAEENQSISIDLLATTVKYLRNDLQFTNKSNACMQNSDEM